jgi:hypothetical protein
LRRPPRALLVLESNGRMRIYGARKQGIREAEIPTVARRRPSSAKIVSFSLDSGPRRSKGWKRHGSVSVAFYIQSAGGRSIPKGRLEFCRLLLLQEKERTLCLASIEHGLPRWVCFSCIEGRILLQEPRPRQEIGQEQAASLCRIHGQSGERGAMDGPDRFDF